MGIEDMGIEDATMEWPEGGPIGDDLVTKVGHAVLRGESNGFTVYEPGGHTRVTIEGRGEDVRPLLDAALDAREKMSRREED